MEEVSMKADMRLQARSLACRPVGEQKNGGGGEDNNEDDDQEWKTERYERRREER